MCQVILDAFMRRFTPTLTVALFWSSAAAAVPIAAVNVTANATQNTFFFIVPLLVDSFAT